MFYLFRFGRVVCKSASWFLLKEAVDFYLDYSFAIQYISKSITCEYKNFSVCINDRQRHQYFYFQYLYNRFYLLCSTFDEAYTYFHTDVLCKDCKVRLRKVNRENQSRIVYESPGVDKLELFLMRDIARIYILLTLKRKFEGHIKEKLDQHWFARARLVFLTKN